MDSQVTIIIFGNHFIWSNKIFSFCLPVSQPEVGTVIMRTLLCRINYACVSYQYLGSVPGMPNHTNSIETTSMSSSGSHIQHRTKSASLNPFKGFSKLNPFHRKSERSSKKYKQKAEKVLNVRK